MKGSAEIVGGGFAGLTAACALAQRGWRVRVHERADRLRTAGAGINVYENGLRVLEALGACDDTIRDGARARLRETLGLVSHRRYLRDGCTRVLIPTRSAEEGTDSRTIEYWSGSHRLLYNPCSTTHLYLALSMPHDDVAARALPVDKAVWKQSFPQLGSLIDRIGDDGRYDRFEYIRLKRWSAERVAVIGDAAHAIPPHIGQVAGCAILNALSLAVFLDRGTDIPAQLTAWEQAERPL